MELADYLEKHDVSQKKFAGLVGVTQSMVSQWINGVRPIAAEKVIPIEGATKGRVSRHELRPDIYPRKLNPPAKT
jgi:DNA-binding transcriptional regulator YdaS (Cro superfamily)